MATHLDQSFMQIPAKLPAQALPQSSKEDRAMFHPSDIKPLQGAQHSPGQALRSQAPRPATFVQVRGKSGDLQSELWISIPPASSCPQ